MTCVKEDHKAIQLKLDELLRATKGAETGFVDLENMDDAALEKIGNKFKSLYEQHAGHEMDGHEGETAREDAPSR